MSLRVGQGVDVHALVENRPLIVGGVLIPYTHGLAGHSDADVLLHAVTDAILGAAALGDIGRHFPDTDERYKGADSRVLLRDAMQLVRQAGWEIINIDATIHAHDLPVALLGMSFLNRMEMRRDGNTMTLKKNY